MNTFGERLKSIIPIGMSQSKFAKEIKVANSTLSLWLAGGSLPKLDALESISHLTGCDLNWLIAGKQGSVAAIDPDEFTYIRKFKVELSAGAGAGAIEFAANQQPETIGFNTKWLKSLTSTPAIGLSVATAKGDSMEPTINNGALVLVDHTVATIEADGIFAFVIDDDLFVKRIQKLVSGGLIIKSDNNTYKDQEITDPELIRFTLCGKVLWVGNDL